MRGTIRAAYAALALLAGTACGGASATGGGGDFDEDAYASISARTMFQAAVRIRVGCFDGLASVGSGVAITSKHVLTARHVVEGCKGRGGYATEAKVIIATTAGHSYEMVVDAVASNADVVRLVALGNRSPFRRWATIGDGEARLGEEVCTVGGDGNASVSVMKCGRVSSRGAGWLSTGIPLVHGNSGGPVYDAAGRVLGLWTRAALNPGEEPIGLAASSTAWRELVLDPRQLSTARSLGF